MLANKHGNRWPSRAQLNWLVYQGAFKCNTLYLQLDHRMCLRKLQRSIRYILLSSGQSTIKALMGCRKDS